MTAVGTVVALKDESRSLVSAETVVEDVTDWALRANGGVIRARLRLSKNSLYVWMILLLGKEHIIHSTFSVRNVGIRSCLLHCLSQILKVKKKFGFGGS